VWDVHIRQTFRIKKPLSPRQTRAFGAKATRRRQVTSHEFVPASTKWFYVFIEGRALLAFAPMMPVARRRWRLIDAPFILALAALLLLSVAAAAAPQAVEEGFTQPQMVQQQPMGLPQQQQMGFSQLGQPPTGLGLPQQPQQSMEVPLPRMLVPGYGIFDMPTFDAYEPDGLRAQPEAEDDDATSSYNATEIMGSREAEIRRLEAQIKLSFHKEVSGSRIEPRGWIDQTHTSGAGRRAGSRSPLSCNRPSHSCGTCGATGCATARRCSSWAAALAGRRSSLPRRCLTRA